MLIRRCVVFDARCVSSGLSNSDEKSNLIWVGGEVGESRRTVNPFPLGEWVRLPPCPPYDYCLTFSFVIEINFVESVTWGISSVGRAPALQVGGHEFESRILHQGLTIAKNKSYAEFFQSSGIYKKEQRKNFKNY